MRVNRLVSVLALAVCFWFSRPVPLSAWSCTQTSPDTEICCEDGLNPKAKYVVSMYPVCEDPEAHPGYCDTACGECFGRPAEQVAQCDDGDPSELECYCGFDEN